MTRVGRRLGAVAVVAIGLVVGAASTSWAAEAIGAGGGGAPAEPGFSIQTLPGGPWPEHWYTHYTSTVYQKGTFQGYREDQNRGSRIQSEVAFKEVGFKSDVRGAYMAINWYANTNRCYYSAYDVSSGIPVGVNCSTGWWGDGYYETQRTTSDSYWYWEVWNPVDPLASSGRGSFKGCLDIAAATDKCTASILRGAAYE
jgi:hypothetical protein